MFAIAKEEPESSICCPMKLSQLALQLYTLRDFCQNEAALATTLRRVREIGYQAVQVSGIGPIDPAAVAALCAGEGLVICATHESSALIRRDPSAVEARLKAYGTAFTAYPYPADVNFSDPASLGALVDDLRRAGEYLAQRGLRLNYHNHATEFLKVGGVTVMEHLFRELPAGIVDFELDTYWVQYGGGSPADWCRKLAGRLHVLHLKDYAILPGDKPAFAEIGAGNLNFPAIIEAAAASGCQWYVVEQDICPGDPFDSVEASFSYCSQFLCDSGA